MSDEYRHRAQAVRQETRAHLAALRAARRGDRRGADTTSGDANPSAARANAEVDHAIFLPPESTPQPTDDLAAAAVSAGQPDASDQGMAASAPPVVAATVEFEPPSTAVEAEPPATVMLAAADEAAVPSSADVTPDSAAAPTSETAGATAGSLERLPGIGPGLIWFFEQRGIVDLAALAAADSDQLRADIGFIGSLIDFDGWIAFARDHARA